MRYSSSVLITLLYCIIQDIQAADYVGVYFYKEIGCYKKDGTPPQYECPNFSLNGTCRFRNSVLKIGDKVDKELIKGSCHADCQCTTNGRMNCTDFGCPDRLKSGCSHFKYSLDTCCDVDSVCGPIAECTLDGETYQEGNYMYPKNSCEVCICDVNFKKESPFCRPRKCFDQTNHQVEFFGYGAPVFFKDEKCCPSTWITDEGDAIRKMNKKAEPNSGSFCKFGDKIIQLGYGFERKVKRDWRDIPVHCECSLPPFLICTEI
ncbi:hypothetical protein WA026_011493 [Henosepilachna vigintioctopunctata]|uniref:VWFC domain-containing protein n=1 Tax=Henosepilachna vigintioctopunctata TaxID=420089 RepID=A0AAW1TU05_9CUCU